MVGRRVTESYLLFWLHSLPPAVSARYNFDQTSARVLNTYVLGELVAPKWGISTRMRWSSPHVDVKYDTEPGNARQIGLYKVAGMGVEAVVGGIYHQFVRSSRLVTRLV